MLMFSKYFIFQEYFFIQDCLVLIEIEMWYSFDPTSKGLTKMATANTASKPLRMLTALITASMLKEIKVLTSGEPGGQH